MVVTTVSSLADYEQLMLTAASSAETATSSVPKKTALFFWASWHAPSNRGGQMHGVFSALSDKYANSVQFAAVEAEAVPAVSEAMEVAVVPTFIALVGDTVVAKVEGADPAEVNKMVKQLNEIDVNSVPQQKEIAAQAAQQQLQLRLKQLTTAAPVMLFMKGSPDSPRCGFSRQIVELLQQHEIPFASFDILTDEEVRAGLKTYSDWPTFPQLYIKGEFTGGLDIIKEMAATAAVEAAKEATTAAAAVETSAATAAAILSLKQQLGIADLHLPPPPLPLQQRLQQLTTTSAVMLFMKGSPDAPRCGFSRQIVQLLREEKIDFSHFDILEDEEVRAGLKTYSDWPTFPQLYVKGEFTGGLDIIKEMQQAGNLRDQLAL